MRLMREAGADPRAINIFFRKLVAQEQQGGGGLLSAFRSHPLTEERIDAVDRMAEQNEPARPQPILSREAWQAMKSACAGPDMRGYLPFQRESRFAIWAERFAYLAVPTAVLAVLLARSGRVEPAHAVALVVVAALLAMMALAVAGVASIDIWRHGRSGLFRLLRTVLLALWFWRGGLARGRGWAAAAAQRHHDRYRGSAGIFALLGSAGGPQGACAAGPRPARTRAPADGLCGFAPASARHGGRSGVPAGAGGGAETALAGHRAIRPRWPLGQGRIEAIAETTLLRFQDDITIRLRPTPAGTRVDIRSASRIGRHDFGANAKRIRRLSRKFWRRGNEAFSDRLSSVRRRQCAEQG